MLCAQRCRVNTFCTCKKPARQLRRLFYALAENFARRCMNMC
ncbi:hypothetical protein HMPREF9248_0409 [Fannyhessea vaginae PB189-T1-4]|uniref:Uncharacterized protein n=1 Tax=Fannyhessea vaginae PB189-T1-4 TaxID=866774 RepID=A0ABN0B0T3_9ACTN|nr:hypothetical protein HMPREF9248_0409 [Fannyhessea vaginae PB189-T1-4]